MSKPEPSEAAIILGDKIEMMYADEYGTDHRDEIARLCYAALRDSADLAAGAALCDYISMKEACEKAEAEVGRLREAVRAHNAWFLAENNVIGTFQDRMNLCAYAEWMAKRALGDEAEPFEGVPEIIVFPKVSRECIDEDAARDLMATVEHAALCESNE